MSMKNKQEKNARISQSFLELACAFVLILPEHLLEVFL